MSLPPFAIRPKKKGARQRRLLQAAPASSAHSAPKNITFDPEDAKEDQRDEKAIEKIEDHLLKMFRQESKMPVAQLATDGAAQQQQQQHAQGQQPQPSAQKPVAFRLELLPQYFRIEGLSLALPYSVDNQRFLQMLEQGRLPWEHLRSLPGLREMCADKYQNGGLTFEVQDRRVPEHCYDSGLRHVHVAQDDDVMLQDLQQACMVNMMSDDPNVMPWTDEFKIFLEALLVSHISPAPCLHPSLAVGRLCNMLQFNRLKLNSRRLRTVSVDLIPLPLKRSRFAPATYGSWVRSQHAGQQSAPMLDQPAERSGKRVRKPTAVGMRPPMKWPQRHILARVAPPHAQPPQTRHTVLPTSLFPPLLPPLAPHRAALENMQGKRDPDDPLGMKLEPQATGSMALGGNAPLGDPYARPYSNGGKGPRAQHGGKGGKGPPGGKAAVAPGARGKGIRPDGDEREPPPPGANFSLLARLAVLSGQQSQSQLQRLPQGGDAFNQIATKAMRDSKMTPHHDEHAIARCRGLQPEDLLPTDLPLPPHGSHDPLNVSKTLTFGVRPPAPCHCLPPLNGTPSLCLVHCRRIARGRAWPFFGCRWSPASRCVRRTGVRSVMSSGSIPQTPPAATRCLLSLPTTAKPLSAACRARSRPSHRSPSTHTVR